MSLVSEVDVMFRKLLVAVAQSEFDRQILDEAIAIAQANHAALMLLHVLSPFDEAYPGVAYPGVDGIYPGIHQTTMQTCVDQWKKLEQEGVALLRSLTQEAIEAGVNTEFTQRLGDPGRVICEVAQTWKADLIMVGRRGRIGLTEFFLGSVSNYVLHHAPCSVLTVQKFNSTKSETQTDTAVLRS
jgi:nucleotide-binding universal stress UspA family protein